MNALAVIDRLADSGSRSPSKLGPGVLRAVVVGPVEVAAARQAGDPWLRARWKERVGNTPQPYLLLADERDDAPGRVCALGPSRSDTAVQVVDAGLLHGALERVAKEPRPLAAVRRLSNELARLGGEGLTCRGLLTRHTLESRLAGDVSRWQSASELCRGIRSDSGWRQVLERLGLQVERLPGRGYLLRHDQAPAAVVHPKRHVRGLTRVGADGRLPEGLLLGDCIRQGARYGILAADGRFRLFDARSASAASEWLELDLRLLAPERRGFMALLGPEYLANGGLDELRAEAALFGGRREQLKEARSRVARVAWVRDRTPEETRRSPAGGPVS